MSNWYDSIVEAVKTAIDTIYAKKIDIPREITDLDCTSSENLPFLTDWGFGFGMSMLADTLYTNDGQIAYYGTSEIATKQDITDAIGNAITYINQ